MLLDFSTVTRLGCLHIATGVSDALAKGFLKNLFFGISENPEGTQLLEVGTVANMASWL